MIKTKFLFAAVILFLIVGISFSQTLSKKEQLGKLLFYDENLSEPQGQSCATCHAPEVGFTGPDPVVSSTTVVYPGAVPTRFGNRKPPSSAYCGASPVFHYDKERNIFVGGMFWDGRATGWELGDPVAEQAKGPFLNPVEQNIPDDAELVSKVQKSSYANLFEEVYGNIWADVKTAYNKIADAVAAYEKSDEVNPFSSKYDYFLKGKVKLTDEELKGLELFRGKGKCENCHISKPGPDGESPVFTDYTYDNIGIPKNPKIPFYTQPADINPDGLNWIDKGLGEFLETLPEFKQYAAENMGKHKVPTLRNVDLRPSPDFLKVYGHNGFFTSLKSIVHFYNTRDVGDWAPPEVPENLNKDEMGNLGLTEDEENAIVAFLKTLSDGYVVK